MCLVEWFILAGGNMPPSSSPLSSSLFPRFLPSPAVEQVLPFSVFAAKPLSSITVTQNQDEAWLTRWISALLQPKTRNWAQDAFTSHNVTKEYREIQRQALNKRAAYFEYTVFFSCRGFYTSLHRQLQWNNILFPSSHLIEIPGANQRY